MESANTTTRSGKPPSRRRVLFYLLFPILIPVLFMAGIRIMTEAQAVADSRQSEALDHESPAAIEHTVFPTGVHRAAPPMRVADPSTQSLIEKAVRGQLKALTAGNYPAALNYSAAEFRTRITPEGFQQLVIHGYAAMTDCQHVTFSSASIQAGGFGIPRQARLEAYVVGTGGSKTQYEYVLSGDADGWFVQSVNPVNMPTRFSDDPRPANIPADGQIHHT